MRVVGITGTNGKTTTSFLVSAILDAAGVQCGLMGTVTYRIGDRAFDATRTTPEAPDLQAFMRDMVAGGCGACVGGVVACAGAQTCGRHPIRRGDLHQSHA